MDFTVAPEHGLSDTCDFIVSRSPEQFYLRAPVIIIVEAKNDRITFGLPQCLAEMVAAQMFNARLGTGIETVYGIVSTGSLWRCLALTGTAACIDRDEYHLHDLATIFGILAQMVGADGAQGP